MLEDTQDFDPCNFVKVVFASTNHNFGNTCDSLWHHRLSEMSFSADYLNTGTVEKHEIASPWAICTHCGFEYGMDVMKCL